MKAKKYEQRWRNGAINDVKLPEMLAVLEENGFKVRTDRGQHILAQHPLLAEHPLFSHTNGRIRINAHAHGNPGLIHPNAVRDVLKALDYIRKEK